MGISINRPTPATSRLVKKKYTERARNECALVNIILSNKEGVDKYQTGVYERDVPAEPVMETDTEKDDGDQNENENENILSLKRKMSRT